MKPAVRRVSGGTGRSRTFDRRIKSPLLYQLSYDPGADARLVSMIVASSQAPCCDGDHDPMRALSAAAHGLGVEAFAHQQRFAALLDEASTLKLRQGAADGFA